MSEPRDTSGDPRGYGQHPIAGRTHSRWRAWRIQRAQDRLDDAEARLSKWGWSYYPSQKRKAEAEIVRLQARLDRLTAPARVQS